MDAQRRGFILPAALSVVVVAGLVTQCSSESETSVANADAGADAIALDSPPCVPWTYDAQCIGFLACTDGAAEAEQCCECHFT